MKFRSLLAGLFIQPADAAPGNAQPATDPE